MNSAAWAVALAIGLFFGLVACLEVGFRIGIRSQKRHPEFTHEGTGAIDAAVLALLGLLLAFTFAGSMSRLDARRQLIVREANAIGTAYLRLDVLPASEQHEMRELFRKYIDTRLRAYRELPHRKAVDEELANAAQIQQQIWSHAVTAGRTDPSQNTATPLLLFPALNEMIDVTTARAIALDTHLPPLIFLLLVLVALLSGLLTGYAMAKRKRRSLLHMFLYAAVIAMTIYAVLDLEYPRSGLIRLDPADKALIELRDSIR